MIVGQEGRQDGRMSARRIGSDNGGQKVKARFIHKTRILCSKRAFSFISTQTSLRQRAMASSSRWVARSIGICGVHLKSFNKRATCDLLYDTPNSHSITLRIRRQVHTLPRNPY